MDFVKSLVRIGNRVKKSFITGKCLGNKSRRKELLQLALTFYSLGPGQSHRGLTWHIGVLPAAIAKGRE